MQYITLGRTGLRVSRTAFGVLPLQRVPLAEAVPLLRKAHEGGINFFDTARAYSDSEEKIGAALGAVRDEVIIASKSHGKDAAEVRAHLDTSLRSLHTDHLDLLQLHNAATLLGEEDPRYQELRAAQASGKVRFIGVTCHRLNVARAAVASGLYDTVQFPLSAISSAEDLQLIDDCRAQRIGLIAMKALCGGLLTNIPAAFAFLRQYDNVVPIWGIQRERELDEFLALEDAPPQLDAAMWDAIARDRRELAADFCRGCGYCLPCPEGIPIPMAARMSFLLRRAPYQQFLSEHWQHAMHTIEKCRHCGQCTARCPYQLDTPSLLAKMLDDYQEFFELHVTSMDSAVSPQINF